MTSPLLHWLPRLGVFAATVLATGVTLAQPRSDLGRIEYEANCQSCHGVGGRGDGPYSVNLKLPVPDLTLLAQRSGGVFPADRVQRLIDGREDLKGHGGRQMPIWGLRYGKDAVEYFRGDVADPETFTRQRVQALTAYLRTLQR
ncbi:MAG: cytochrome c [Burkholderiaceae bacterium]|nr:cytochrome c [Burkholderiaceae bacterium]